MNPPDYRRELDSWSDIIAEIEREESYVPVSLFVDAALCLAVYRMHAPKTWRPDFVRLADRLADAARGWTAAPCTTADMHGSEVDIDDLPLEAQHRAWKDATGKG